MATNDAYQPGNRLSLPCSAPATPKSGDPVLVGDLPGVALLDEGAGGNDAANTSIQTDGVWKLLVRGENAAGTGTALTVGQKIYYDAAMSDAGGAHLNADATNGKYFGYVLEAVASAATARVNVKVGY